MRGEKQMKRVKSDQYINFQRKHDTFHTLIDRPFIIFTEQTRIYMNISVYETKDKE